MKTSTRIPEWDGWRGLAILLVLVGHFTFSKWVWEERMGVDVFFVLSGMLMSNILFVERMPLKDFYIRRFSRVVPALFVFLLGAVVVSLILQYEFHPIEFVASLIFVRTYFPADPEFFTTALPIGHLWSLSVEEHSYIIMSLISIVLLARGRIITALFGLYLLSLFFCWYNYLTVPAQEFAATLIRTETTIGFITFSAAYNLWTKEKDVGKNGYLSIVCLALAFLCYLRVLPVWLTFTLGPILLGIAINHLQASAPAIRKILCFAPLRWLGILSFSIYLWQQVFYKLYYALPGGALTGFVLSILFGAGSYFVIENPARRYIDNRWSKSGKSQDTGLVPDNIETVR